MLEAGKHPNADRLQFCQVDVGEAAPRPIVCGAWNFEAGDTVAVALPGTVLLDGRRIARSKLRGETSDGMILSERELDISPEGEGIIVLGDGWKPGEPLASRMPLAHDVLELEVTSNRADLLSMRGVARDVHAIFGIDLAPLDDSEPPALGDRLTADWITITIEDEDLCPRFTARVFQDVNVGPSPLWLKARLNAAGMRPISNVVDITNYVMHDLGSPLHAYDHAHLRGSRLTARRARPGETLRTLDGQERELDPAMLVIADAEGPQGIAGIMGAADSEVARRHDDDRARGGQLHALPDPAHLAAARPALRGLQPLGEGRGPPPGAARLARGRAAARAVVRRAHDAAPDRRLRRPAAAPAAAGAHGARRAHHRARGVAGAGGRDPRSPRLRSARRAGHDRRARADDALRRRHARDRRDRGDRPHLRARARSLAALGRLGRRPDARPSACAARSPTPAWAPA